MSRFEILVLGNSSALPAYGRHPSAQLINIHEQFLLIDCGEGTQERIAQYHAKAHKIDHIFISHLHGDHYFGLPGLITSLNLTGRKNSLHIYSPPGLKGFIEYIMQLANASLNFEICWHELVGDQSILCLEDNVKKVIALPVNHRISTYGFIIEEQPGKRVFMADRFGAHLPPFESIKKLKNGEDVLLDNGIFLKSNDYTLPPVPPKKYSYCSDTLYEPDLIPFISNSDLLYHEATYAEMHAEKAKQNFHSTAREAAQIALLSKVKRLMIGHYSSRYKHPEILLKEAKTTFENCILADEGNWYQV